jgi:hypothetical protein
MHGSISMLLFVLLAWLLYVLHFILAALTLCVTSYPFTWSHNVYIVAENNNLHTISGVLYRLKTDTNSHSLVPLSVIYVGLISIWTWSKGSSSLPLHLDLGCPLTSGKWAPTTQHDIRLCLTRESRFIG